MTLKEANNIVNQGLEELSKEPWYIEQKERFFNRPDVKEAIANKQKELIEKIW